MNTYPIPTLAFLLLCLPHLGHTENVVEPTAELHLELVNSRLAYDETFQFKLTLKNTGTTPIPVIKEKSTWISTRQLFFISTLLEPEQYRGTDAMTKLLRDSGLYPLEGVHMGTHEQAQWKHVARIATTPLEPGESLVLTDRDIMLHDLVLGPPATRVLVKAKFMIGDGVWVSSNEVECTFVDKRPMHGNSHIIRILPRNNLRNGIPINRIEVNREQWIYKQHTRIATLPADFRPEFYGDPESGMLWIDVPGHPDKRVMVDQMNKIIDNSNWEDPPERLLLPEPTAPLRWSAP